MSGVELATALAGIQSGGTTPGTLNVTLVEAGTALLPGESPPKRQRISRTLQESGISVRTGAPVTAVERDRVYLHDEALAADIVVWTAGVRGNTVLDDVPVETDQGRIVVDETNRSVTDPRIFAVGDAAVNRRSPSTHNVAYAKRSGRAAGTALADVIRQAPIECIF